MMGRTNSRVLSFHPYYLLLPILGSNEGDEFVWEWENCKGGKERKLTTTKLLRNQSISHVASTT
jgi:hypothetical protein